MAKPDDTRITHGPANADQGSNTKATPIPPDLTPILQALLAREATRKPVPKPPKSARPPRIKPRRRVTVSTSAAPASDVAIPWLRLCGHWLVPAGFAPHTRVQVHVGKGVLILLAEDESQA